MSALQNSWGGFCPPMQLLAGGIMSGGILSGYQSTQAPLAPQSGALTKRILIRVKLFKFFNVMGQNINKSKCAGHKCQ